MTLHPSAHARGSRPLALVVALFGLAFAAMAQNPGKPGRPKR
jgi:hypothetical protein